LQAVTVAPQQFGQARPRQTAKLLLGAELDSQDRALRRGLRQWRCNRWLLRTWLLEVGLVVERAEIIFFGLVHRYRFVLLVVFAKGDILVLPGRGRGGGQWLLGVVVDQAVVEHQLRLRFLRHQPRLQLACEIADLILALAA